MSERGRSRGAARNPAVWTSQGQLRSHVVRQCAEMLQAGHTYSDICKAVEISERVGKRKLAEISEALGIPTAVSAYERDVEEVSRRVRAGETSGEIAQALGRTADSVNAIRRKLGLGSAPRLPLTDDEKAEIDQRLIAGQSTRQVANAVGCHQSAVAHRLKPVRHNIADDLPPCACGKRRNHGGRCKMIADPQIIRQRLLAGKTTAAIAREFGRTAQSFKPKYVQPVIDQLTAEGHSCGCGQPFGHQFACKVTRDVQRRTFTGSERAKAASMVREGLSVAKIKVALGITTNSANILVREVRTALAAVGVRCPCGEPINHSRSCAARNDAARGRSAFRFTCTASASMPMVSRRKVSKLARQGWQIGVIVRRTGESEWRVTQMVEELARAGHLPAKCAGCDLPRGHRAPCAKPKICRCGRPCNHRGACRRANRRISVPVTKLSQDQLEDLKRRYRARQSIRGISRATGITFSVVQRAVKQFRERATYEPSPCACGRPAWHKGSCWATKNGVVGKRHIAMIERGIRAGQTSHQIADRLGVAVTTVLKHLMPIRDQLFAEGITCACGRPVNHNYWCSARWDAFEMPRGRRPLPEPMETLAIQALRRGDSIHEIAKAVGVGRDSILRLRQTFTVEERDQRARAMRARAKQNRELQPERLLASIKSAVSNRIDAALRDDVISEIYLAVIEGRIEPEQVRAVVRSFVSKGMAEWQPLHGPRSLNQSAFEDGGATVGDLVGDSTAIEQMDELSIGGRPS